MLDEACKRGNASLNGTDINLGVLCERLAILLTSLTNPIDDIRCGEYFDLTHVDSERLQKACTSAGLRLWFSIMRSKNSL